MAKWATAYILLLTSVSCSVFGQTIRLVSPLDNGVGRLEVYYNGVWGTVCDDDFGAEEAKVACRQLGRYKSGLTPRAIQEFGFGGGRIWLDDMSCSGTESSLASCSHRSWGVHDCEHSEDVGIICDPSDIKMKLTPSYKKGLLQVFHFGSWGTVCDDGFGLVEASVVCRALGYEFGEVIDESSSNKMWLDDVQCTLLDTDLKDCKHAPWGTNNCGDSEAVGVECFSYPQDTLRIHLEPPGSVLNVLLGQPISVKCVVDYSNSPVTSFRWTHGGRSYSGQIFNKTITSKSDSGTLTCSVQNVRASTRINVWSYSLIGDNTVTAIATGSVGLVIILILIIIIIYQRRRMQTAKAIENPQRTAQTPMANDGGSQQMYETVELPSGDDDPAHIYGNHAFEDAENILQETGTASGQSSGDI